MTLHTEAEAHQLWCPMVRMGSEASNRWSNLHMVFDVDPFISIGETADDIVAGLNQQSGFGARLAMAWPGQGRVRHGMAGQRRGMARLA